MSDVARNFGKVVRMPIGVSVFGPFRFEVRSGRLSRGDADIHLTPRASSVLRYLITHRGRIVTKDELFAEVWKGVNVTDDALLQVVSAVRKALGDDPRRPEYVQTVTGEGYRFIADVQDMPAPGVGSMPMPVGGVAAASGGATTQDAAATAPTAPTTPTTPTAATAAAGQWRNAAMGLAAVSAIFVAWGLWSGAFNRWATGAGGSGEQKSIAVLPFVNLSDDPANEYFSDGLAAHLLSVLGGVDGLRVAARTSSFAFKGQSRDIGEIGRQLNVATILEGSVFKDGNQVRIVATLINVADGFELWTETYEAELDDVFAIQKDIAVRVAEALTIPLMGDDVARLSPPTDNLAAYEAYLQGKHFLSRYSADAFRAAARNFDRAIGLDPDFALAYVGLADAYLMQNRYGILPLPEALAAAEPAIEQAMQLDDQLGEAWAMLGLVRQRGRDIEGATSAYERAIVLNPNSARTYQLYWWMLFIRHGDTEQTRALADKALRSDPLSPMQNENFGWSLFEEGLFDEAFVYFEKSVELEPAYSFGYMAIGVYHQSFGRIDQAIESFERAVALSPQTSVFRQNLGSAYAAAGRVDDAIEQFAAVIEVNPEDGGRYGSIGEVYWDVLGRPDQAVGWYQQAIDKTPVPRLQTLLAQVYLDLGDEAAAERQVAAATELGADNRWAQVGRLNLYLYGARYEEGEDLAQRMASSGRFFGYLAQFDRPYADYAPLGYFGLLLGEPDDARVFPEGAYPTLLEDDPVINRFNINAAIDLAAALMRTGDDGQADLLLRRSLEFIESQPESLRRTTYREEPAEIYALRGMVTEALAALRSAIDQGWRRGWWRARHKPHYATLRAEPEFQAMLAELEAEADRMRRGMVEER